MCIYVYVYIYIYIYYRERYPHYCMSSCLVLKGARGDSLPRPLQVEPPSDGGALALIVYGFTIISTTYISNNDYKSMISLFPVQVLFLVSSNS